MEQQIVVGALGFVLGVLVTNAAWWIAMLQPKRARRRRDRETERGIFWEALRRAEDRGDHNGAAIIRKEAALRGITFEARS